jgi:RNA polymerase sigma-70 factor (ECF subfamily)
MRCMPPSKVIGAPPPEPATDGRLPPPSALPWVQPFPDALMDLPGPSEEQPDALVLARETIALAYLVAIQLLPPPQRAVLVLRDVLRFSAKETGELLRVTIAAANSALQRARATLSTYQDSLGLKAPTTTAPPTPDERELLHTYICGHTRRGSRRDHRRAPRRHPAEHLPDRSVLGRP